MSGRFPKCMTPGCRRLLIRKTGTQQLTCGGCQETYQVADLIAAEKNASLERSASEQQSNTSQRNTLSSDDEMRQPSIVTSAYPISHQMYRSVLEGSVGHNRSGSATSFCTEDYFMEREKDRNYEKKVISSVRMPKSYASGSSRSISSDEGGSTMSRNTNATSRRTRSDMSATDSSNEEEKIKPKVIDTDYPLGESKMDQQAGSTRGSIISEELKEREQNSKFNAKFSYQNARDLNSSFDITVPYTPYGYKPNSGQEEVGPKRVPDETNYSRSSKKDLIDDNSVFSEEDIEETAYPSGRNSYTYFEGSTSSRSFSSDEGGSRIGPGDSRFRSKRTHRPRRIISDNPYDAAQFNRVEENNMSSEQDDLSDLVNELAKLGLTREKLLLVLLKQTEASIKEESMPKNRNTRSLVRQLTFQIPHPESSDSGSSKGRRRPAMHCCRPLMGGTPFVTCQGCGMLLQLTIGVPTKKFVKIRCGECSEMQVCPFPAKGVTYNPLHKALGYGSARMLMAPSRQFSLIDDDN